MMHIDASVSEMSNKLDFKTLTEKRNKSKLILFYKVLNNSVDIDTSNILYPRLTVHDTRGHHLSFLPLTTRVNSYHNSFFPSAIRNWNNLPEYVINATSLEHFYVIYSMVCIILLIEVFCTIR